MPFCNSCGTSMYLTSKNNQWYCPRCGYKILKSPERLIDDEHIQQNLFGICGVICGLLGIYYCFLLPIGIIFGIFGIVLGSAAIKYHEKYGIGAIVLSILSIIAGISFTIFWSSID